jgi:D-alanyl-D-alanine carboxypeptidase-like protein
MCTCDVAHVARSAPGYASEVLSPAQRRLAFALILVTLVVAGGLLFLRSPDQPGVAAATPSTTSHAARPSASASVAPEDAMPPAWLAWISGSLPPSFAGRVDATPELGTTVIVAGDTRWMRSSERSDGTTVDRPKPPYEIPLDAFAVDPAAYEPFIPPAYRDAVTAALEDGKAVLGASSARLRHLDVGGTIRLATGSLEVGAIVPDDVAGWSELLVSRDTGTRIGIVDDRYLLAMPDDAMTEQRFAHIVGSLLPDTNVRTLPPGGSTYMRIASGVNPPIVIKERFGEFSAYPEASDPAALQMSPTWYDAHIATRSVPLLGNVTCNVALFPQLVGALKDVEAAGLGGEIHTYSGCYNPRTVARMSTAPPSQHAYGAAIDINAPENPYGATPTMDPRIVKIFERWGFLWGGNYLTPDGMHFEYGGPPGSAPA